MVNNRLYLKCYDCGAKLFLGKSMMDGYYTGGFFDAKQLSDFFGEHTYCIKGENGPYSDGDFKLEYEDPFECPKCKGAIDADDKYCRHCGQLVVWDDGKKPKKEWIKGEDGAFQFMEVKPEAEA